VSFARDAASCWKKAGHFACMGAMPVLSTVTGVNGFFEPNPRAHQATM
jgi:hypothetical protein